MGVLRILALFLIPGLVSSQSFDLCAPFSKGLDPMIGQTQREKNSALDDLSEGMMLLFGFDRSRPRFIQALLDDLGGGGQSSTARTDAKQGTSRHRRSRGSSKLQLVRVEKL